MIKRNHKGIFRSKTLFICILIAASFIINSCTPSPEKEVEKLIGYLSDETRNKNTSLLEEDIGELVKIGEPAVEPLISAYWNDEENAREYWRVLYRIGDPRATEIAVDVLNRKETFNATNINNAREFLEKQGISAYPVLLEDLISKKFINSNQIDGLLKNYYFGEVGGISTGYDNFSELFNTSETSDFLIAEGKDAIPFLKTYISPDKESVNGLILSMVREIDRHEALGLILEMLDSNSEAVLLPALENMIYLWYDQNFQNQVIREIESKIGILEELLVFDNESVNAVAAWALTQSTNPLALKLLSDQIDSENPLVRIAAIIGGDSIQTLVDAMDDDSMQIRELVIKKMATLPLEDTPIQALVDAMDDDSREIRKLVLIKLTAFPIEEIPMLSQAFYEVNSFLKDKENEEFQKGQEFQDLQNSVRKEQLAVVTKFYQYLILRGDPRAEDALIWTLQVYGDQSMANIFLNCGNIKLSDASRVWANEHGYSITSFPSLGNSTKWGTEN